MKKIISFALLIALTTSCSMWSEKKHPGWHQASGGEQLEQLFWQAVQRKDWQSLEAHMSATFTTVASGRTLDRAATLEYLKAAEVKSFTLSEVNVTPNRDTMTVAYVLTAEPGHTTSRRMTVWQRQKSGWVAIAHAESK